MFEEADLKGNVQVIQIYAGVLPNLHICGRPSKEGSLIEWFKKFGLKVRLKKDFCLTCTDIFLLLHLARC